MRFRSADVLGAEHIGRRVTVRRAVPEGGTSDVIGILRSLDDTELVVTTRTGADVTIRRADIVASRVISARGTPRRRSV